MAGTDKPHVDLLVVGAGPAGSMAARIAAQAGARVLLVEKRPVVGQPVQCAEYVPAQIVQYVDLPATCIAQRIRTLRTHLPDGEVVETPAAGYVLDRGRFDKHLAATAIRAGATLWLAARAVARTAHGVAIQRMGRLHEVTCDLIIGADGPRSTVGKWIGQVNTEMLDAVQVEAVLPTRREGEGEREHTAVYFDPLYRGGYGWLFPKGETANVGVGVNRRMGGDPQRALAHLLARLEISPDTAVGRTAGPVPAGGTVARLWQEPILLVGDAAGHTHPVTGAGILAAVVSGTLAGQAVAHGRPDEYPREWSAFMAGPLRHALSRRQALDARWSTDVQALSTALRESWIAFRAYGRRT